MDVRCKRAPSRWQAGAQAPTHLGRVLQELGIGYVQARSPQGKGRVERLWGTLQDRLVSELRLRTVSTRAAANALLPEFLADFNRRFAQPRPDSIRPLPSWPPRSPSSGRGPIPGVGPTIRASPSKPICSARGSNPSSPAPCRGSSP
jgi:hypothetical protein